MTNGALINSIYQAFARGDIESVIGTFDPDISWTEAKGFMYGGTYVGPESVLSGVFMRIGTEWENFTVTPQKIIDGVDGNVISTGTYSGKFLATGRTTTVPFAHEWEINGGKVIRFVQHTDTLTIARDLGI
jgi:uncharacterized protein